VYKSLKNYIIGSGGAAPTIAEIGRQFQMRSPASVHKVLGVLEDAGKIERVANVSRGIRLVKDGENHV
jgi:repressor LexA